MTSLHQQKFPRSVAALFHLVAIVPLLGYGSYHVLGGNPVLGTFLLLSLVAVLASLVAELINREARRFRQGFVILVACAITYACYVVGLRGLIYVFPMASVFFFTFGITQALTGGALFCAAGLFAALNIEDPVLVARFAVAVTVNLCFSFMFALIVERQREELARQASEDALTGTLNRRGLRQHLEDAALLHSRHHRPFTVFLVDIDHFKAINDQYGHLVGDRVLVEFAQLIKNRLRTSDKLYRFGGEEFIAVLPETDLTQASQLCESLRILVENTEFHLGIRITCSFGVGELGSEESVDEWLSRCDGLLYRAKREGRNRVLAFDEFSGNYQPEDQQSPENI